MMRYVILLAMLLLCLPVRGAAWQVVGGGEGNVDIFSSVAYAFDGPTYQDTNIRVSYRGLPLVGTVASGGNITIVSDDRYDGIIITIYNQSSFDTVRITYEISGDTASAEVNNTNSSISYSNTTLHDSSWIELENNGSGDTTVSLYNNSTSPATITFASVTIVQL